MPTCTALIVAAGRGSRFGGPLPKQYAQLGGQTVLRHSLEAFRATTSINQLRVVIGSGDETHYEAAVAGLGLPAPVLGGATRQQSVLNGLEVLATAPPDFVAIHDAARPFASAALFGRVLSGMAGFDGAVPVIPSADTVKRVRGGRVLETVPRGELGLVQTPQAFGTEALTEAHRKAGGTSMDATDDSMLLEVAGYRVAAVEGEATNFKITTQDDLRRGERHLADLQHDRAPEGAR